MTKKPQTSKETAKKVVKNIRRKTRQTYSAEEKIRIILAGLRGEESISLWELFFKTNVMIHNLARSGQFGRSVTNAGS